jgi:CHAD domain-containing protein
MLSIFRPLVADGSAGPIAEGLKALMAELSAAREWDVFRAEVVPDLSRALDRPGALDAFVAVVENERAAAHRRADAAVRGVVATQAILDFESWIEGGGAWTALGAEADRPAREAAREILQRLAKKVTRLLDGIAEAEDDRIHDLRLRAKRLRYGAEFFASLFSRRKSKPYLQGLATLQDHIGAFNDGVVGVGMMASLPVDRSAQPELARAIDVATGWCAAIAHSERRDVPAALETFMEQKPFWR